MSAPSASGSYSLYEKRKNTHTQFQGWRFSCSFEDPIKNRVDVFYLAVERKGLSELGLTQKPGHGRIFLNGLAKISIRAPGLHSVSLHETVGIFAQHAGGGEIEEKLAGED